MGDHLERFIPSCSEVDRVQENASPASPIRDIGWRVRMKYFCVKRQEAALFPAAGSGFRMT